MAIRAFTNFKDIQAFTPATGNSTSMAQYLAYKLGEKPYSTAQLCTYESHAVGLIGRTDQGIAFGYGTGINEYNVIRFVLADTILGANVPDGATLTIGFRVTRQTSQTASLAWLANTATPATGAYTSLGNFNPLTGLYFELQVKRLSATTVSLARRLSGGAVVNVTVSQTNIGSLYIGYSQSVQTATIANTTYIEDLYVCFNTTGSDEWLGDVKVARSAPMAVRDYGSFRPNPISSEDLASLTETGMLSYDRTSSSASIAPSTSLGSEPMVLQSSQTYDPSAEILAASLSLGGAAKDANKSVIMTTTIKDSDNNQLATKMSPPNAQTGVYNISCAVVDLQGSSVEPSDLVYEVKNS